MYFYAFIVLCIVAGSVVAFYYLGESVTKLDHESKSKIKICPLKCYRGSKDKECQNCVLYHDAIDTTPSPSEEEEVSGEEEVLEPTIPMTFLPDMTPEPRIGYDEKKDNEMRNRIKIIEEVKSENEYIKKLNERIDEINMEIKN